MSKSFHDMPAIIRDLGDVEEIRSSAKRGGARTTRPISNTHIHLPPNFSAFDSVGQAVTMASKENVRVLGAGNYYDYSVYNNFAALTRKANIFPIFGIEIICMISELAAKNIRVNDPANPGKFYICGKGITKFEKMPRRADELLGKIRAADSERMSLMAEKLGKIFSSGGEDLHLSANDVIEMIARRHGCPKKTVYIQERHLAQAYQKALFERTSGAERRQVLSKIIGRSDKDGDDPVQVQNEIRSRFMKAGKPAFVEEKFVTFDEAYELIIELGGIPCYPTLADGILPVCEYETPVENLIEKIKKLNIHSVEFIPARNKPEVLSEYVTKMRASGLIVIAGTEHNTLDLIPVEPKCLHGAAIPEEIKDIFWEGASVIAAHEFLTLHGECGYIAENGSANTDFKTAEERIGALKKIGETVIERYFEKNRQS